VKSWRERSVRTGRIGGAAAFRVVNCVKASADRKEGINGAGSRGNGANCRFAMYVAGGEWRGKCPGLCSLGERCSEIFGVHGFPLFSRGGWELARAIFDALR
jgi:hypothetical protein